MAINIRSERGHARTFPEALRLIMMLGGITLVAACAPIAPPQGAPTANLVVPPVGSKWVIDQRNSGSYGSLSQQITSTRLADQTWRGKAVRAYSDGSATRLVDIDAGATVAVVREGTPLETFEPGVGWRWPLWAGRSWFDTFSYTDHVRGRTLATVKLWSKVAAYEEVTVPAGKFRTFRIDSDGDGGALVTSSWWSPEIGLTVKSRSERSSRHYLGAGTRDAELLSFDTKR